MSSTWHLMKVSKEPRFVEVHIDAERSPHAWLRGARDVLGLTQEELGAAVGRERRTIARYEGGGKSTPDVPQDVLEAINDLLKEAHAKDKPDDPKSYSTRKKIVG